jgi:uncharacterized protein (TIGR00251 family)
MPGLDDAVRGAGPGAVALELHVEPGSSKPGLAGLDPWRGRLRLRVAARPREGAANREAVDLLAAALGVPPRHVEVVAGATSRLKTLVVRGLDRQEAIRRLVALLGEHPAAEGPQGRGRGREVRGR